MPRAWWRAARPSACSPGPCTPTRAACWRAVPRLDRGRAAKLATIDGAPPNLLNPPVGLPLPPALPLRHREVPRAIRRSRRASRGTWPPATAWRRSRRSIRHWRASASTTKAGVEGRRRAAPSSTSGTPRNTSPCGMGFLRAPKLVRAVDDVTHRHQAPARRWAWSGSPAAGNPPSAAWCCASTTPPAARSASRTSTSPSSSARR